jgi:hypothetical protein
MVIAGQITQRPGRDDFRGMLVQRDAPVRLIGVLLNRVE